HRKSKKLKSRCHESKKWPQKDIGNQKNSNPDVMGAGNEVLKTSEIEKTQIPMSWEQERRS
ncbi:MAG: hypothetical protein ILP10_08180, partial [Lachnospiraceae bacterium]|nr:hypothetical protein [Lachnospiraceae bacterium]